VKHRTLKLHILFVVAGVMAALLSGCGGGSSKPSGSARATGRAAFSIKWPERPSRLIPIASNSIRITVMNGATQLGTQLVARPQTFASFDALPVGSLTAVADAFPNADGTGTAQAHGTVPLAITANNQTIASLTMGSTITHITTTVNTSVITRGESVTITATPMDAANNVVLVAPNGLTWKSANEAEVSVDGTGKVTGISIGTVNITVLDPESGFGVIRVISVEPRLLVALNGVSVIQADGVTGSNLVASGLFTAIHCVARDSRGRIYVGGSDLTRMDDISGNNMVHYTNIGQVDAIAFDGQGRIYIADSVNNAIVRIDDMSGSNRVQLSQLNAPVGDLVTPTGVAVDALGRIYIVDTFERIVRVNDMDGAGGIVAGSLSVSSTQSIAVDKFNRIYVSDPTGGKIARIDDMSGFGLVSYSVANPKSIALDDLGRIYVGTLEGATYNVIRINDMADLGPVSNDFRIPGGTGSSDVVGISVN
jgi:hypothetical protein